jgi:hypothetical protein
VEPERKKERKKESVMIAALTEETSRLDNIWII